MDYNGRNGIRPGGRRPRRHERGLDAVPGARQPRRPLRFANGRDALATIGVLLPDFILVDVRMPVMDGIARVEVIRSYLRWSSIPVAVMTAYPDEHRLNRLTDLGSAASSAKRISHSTTWPVG
jgi:CheY-like chemotaxis protein